MKKKYRMIIKNVIISNHAKDRCKEIGVSPDKITYLLLNAHPEPISFLREFNKLLKYGKKQKRVKYYYREGTMKYPPLLFTVMEEDNKYIVITITKKKL